MDLREYLFKKRISITEFANKLDCTRAYLSRVVNGKKPGKKLIKGIVSATNGEVTFEELTSLKEINPIEDCPKL